MKYKFIVITVLFVALAFISSELSAQCAMCKMAAEDGVKDGNSQSATLNFGILYLLAMPYASFGVIGFLWWKHYKKRKREEA